MVLEHSEAVSNLHGVSKLMFFANKASSVDAYVFKDRSVAKPV